MPEMEIIPTLEWHKAAKDKSASCSVAPMVQSEPLNDRFGQIRLWWSIGGDGSLPLDSFPAGRMPATKEWAISATSAIFAVQEARYCRHGRSEIRFIRPRDV
jgi:hypothetical protein